MKDKKSNSLLVGAPLPFVPLLNNTRRRKKIEKKKKEILNLLILRFYVFFSYILDQKRQWNCVRTVKILDIFFREPSNLNLLKVISNFWFSIRSIPIQLVHLSVTYVFLTKISIWKTNNTRRKNKKKTNQTERFHEWKLVLKVEHFSFIKNTTNINAIEKSIYHKLKAFPNQFAYSRLVYFRVGGCWWWLLDAGLLLTCW